MDIAENSPERSRSRQHAHFTLRAIWCIRFHASSPSRNFEAATGGRPDLLAKSRPSFRCSGRVGAGRLPTFKRRGRAIASVDSQGHVARSIVPYSKLSQTKYRPVRSAAYLGGLVQSHASNSCTTRPCIFMCSATVIAQVAAWNVVPPDNSVHRFR